MNDLEKYRTDNGLTFEALATKVGMSKPGVFRHCKEQQMISGEAALRYHINLGLPLKVLRPDLFCSNNEPPPPEAP
ncbi:helix-turn-helix transcriptional regulator [Maridesulfovibrio ferrireducens]|uniref:helix-turn-helix domain-containing protein n=1 Tax=Maridesulfovibrio ferrireducens TaxID=246191 RepID=UPI001A18BF26|nr:helix-turn-helix transcriptional regulator [Maridesulfovibrio ferrireducens]MBI9110084.1 helix-turn-helix transcriptional regulator [Maridesulfovibrio ferrireducens]